MNNFKPLLAKRFESYVAENREIKENNIQSIHQRRTVELKLQNLNGWEQEDFNEKWDEQPEEKSPTKIYSPPLAPGISVRKVCLKSYWNFNKK